MTRPSLVGRLIRWQILILGAACLSLVLGTVLAGKFWLRQSQDDSLQSFARSVCGGIQKEMSEPEHLFTVEQAAEAFFYEYTLAGHRQELRSSDGRLVVSGRETVEEWVPYSAEQESNGSCMTRDSTRAEDPWLRVCIEDCEGGYFLRVASEDVTHLPAVRAIFWGLIALLPVAVLGGALAGRWVVPILLRPVGELQAAANRMQAEPGLAMGVHAPYRELADLESAFDGLLVRLEQALAREQRFTQEASHELRTPLTAVRLRLEQVRRSHADDRELLQEIDSVLQHCSSLDRLVESLLILARSDRAEIPLVPVNLGDLLREVVSRQGSIDPAFAERLALDAPDEVLVQGHEELLERAVENLLENAREHAGPAASVQVALSNGDGLARIRVTDDGPGVQQSTSDRLFDRFRRGTGGSGKGIGLGLAVVRAILLRHGGSASVSAGVAGGAQFELKIPLYRATAAS